MSNPEGNKGEAPGKNKEYQITVNGKPRTVTEHKLSYWDVVVLAFGDAADANINYSITYLRGEKEDILKRGGSVVVKDGMIFNVTPTGKS